MAESTNSDKSEKWQEILAKGLIGFGFRMLDRGQIFPFFMMLATVTIAVCLVLLTARIPSEEISPFLRGLVDSATGKGVAPAWLATLLLLSLMANVSLATILVLARGYYKAEIRRLGDAKSALEKVVDPNRQGSGHDIGGD